MDPQRGVPGGLIGFLRTCSDPSPKARSRYDLAFYIKFFKLGVFKAKSKDKNPAHRRHSISQHVRLVALISKQTEIDRKGKRKEKWKCHVMSYVSGVICYASGIAYHPSPVINANSHRPSLC